MRQFQTFLQYFKMQRNDLSKCLPLLVIEQLEYIEDIHTAPDNFEYFFSNVFLLVMYGADHEGGMIVPFMIMTERIHPNEDFIK